VNQGLDDLRRVADAYRSAGGRGDVLVQVHVSWNPNAETALAQAFEQWRTNVFSPPLCWDLESPAAFAQAAAHVRPDDVRDAVVVSDSTQQISDAVAEMLAQGYDGAYIHQVPVDQREFLENAAPSILDALGATPARNRKDNA
jgi:hypothetical protein